MSVAFEGRVSTAASTIARARAARSKDTVRRLADQAIRFDPILRARIGSTKTRPLPVDPCARALALWPRLDRVRLTRTKGDPVRIARLVTHRTSLTFDCILAILTKAEDDRPEVNSADRSLPPDRSVSTPRSTVIRPTRSTTIDEQINEEPVTIRSSTSDLHLILAGLRFLLSAEDDAAEIERLKRLIDRLKRR